jgi:uncharacterized protein involved in exopolysaccharide biosynthesis
MIVLVCVVAAALAALAVSLAQETRYTASATILWEGPSDGAQSIDVFPLRDPNREIQTSLQLAGLEVVAERAARRLGGRLDGDEVSARVDVSPKGQSDLLKVEATDPDRRRATLLANAYAAEYVSFRRGIDRRRIRNARRRLVRELASMPVEARRGRRGAALRRQADELEALAALQPGSVEVVQRARTPTTPSSPKALRNILFGAVLGGLLGIALALMAERTRRRGPSGMDVPDPRDDFELDRAGDPRPSPTAAASWSPSRERDG